MTRYCGELKEVSPVTGGELARVKTAEGRTELRVPAGAILRMPAELPLLIIGNRKLRRIRLCLPGLVAFLREGETVCIYAYRHLLRRQVIIGVRSGDGPSWTMGRGQLLATTAAYLLIWPLLTGIPALLAGWILGNAFSADGATLGGALGALFGVGISWLSAARLVLTWRAMKRG